MGITRRGLTVTTDDRDVIAAIDDFTDRLAGIRPGAEAVLELAADQPEVASVQLAAAMFWLYGQTADADGAAGRFVAAARALEPSMNERERATLAAVDRWAARDHLVAAERFEAVVARWPRDLLALKALEFVYYVLGQQHMGPRFLSQVEAAADANPDDADFLAVWAFAAELSGFADRAADLAEAALAIEARTPWAHHALAHVFITRGDPPAAIDRLESFLPVWEASGRVIHAHNAWHLAVAHLDRLAPDRALAVGDAHIWGFAPDTPGEQIDTISLLWRLEMAGEPVDDRRWADVADHVEARVGECVFPFLSAHHGYALARAGRDDAVAALRDTVHRRAEADDGEARRVWQPVGAPVVEACIAHGRGRLGEAAAAFDPAMAEMTAVGGSDAQDDLFRQAYLTALIGAGRTTDARRYWDAMTSFKVRSPLDDRLRAGI
jgi:tetratricopeptide (TPR) repeat protein